MVDKDTLLGTPFHPALGVRHAPLSRAGWQGRDSLATTRTLISIDTVLSFRAQSG